MVNLLQTPAGQLEELRETFQRSGLGVCAISYDSPDVLRDFSRNKQITIPLLSDKGSEIIRAFKLLDTSVSPDNPTYGVPFHGAYLVNEMGIVEAKFFEPNVGHTTGIVLTRLFGSPLNTHEKLVKYAHWSLRYYADTDSVAAGDSLNLTVEVSLNDKVHVYAPGAENHFSLAEDGCGCPGFFTCGGISTASPALSSLRAGESSCLSRNVSYFTKNSASSGWE